MKSQFINEIIEDMFNLYWKGEHTLSSMDNMRKQLYKNLNDQKNGYWSGHSAYSIMVNGGFLINSKRGVKKDLTEFGKKFIKDYEENRIIQAKKTEG